ncbi:MAG TPA: aldolase [Methanoregulaceae archaeon]|nr:aldolase [Methanoregulaceae archaeon]
MLDQEFGRIGRRLFAEGLVGATFGNMSVREGESLQVTRTGCCLDEPGMPVKVPLAGEAPAGASSEYRVHRAVYLGTGYRAIVHAHPVHAVAASLLHDAVEPIDSEGKMLCPLIPVVAGKPGTDELADAVAEGLARAPVVIARGHGTFAGGVTLDEACLYTSLAEHACHVLLLVEAHRRR